MSMYVSASRRLVEQISTQQSSTQLANTQQTSTRQRGTKQTVVETVIEHMVVEETISERAVGERSVSEQAVAHQAVSDRTAAEQAVSDRAASEQAASEQAVADRTASDRAVPDRAVAGRAVPERGAAEQGIAGSGRRFPTGPGWMVHLPIMAPDLAAAVSLAQEMAAWLACVPQIDAGAVEVSAEDEQARRVRVLCQRRISDEERCWLPRKHEGACYAGQRRPQRRDHNVVARRWASAVDI